MPICKVTHFRWHPAYSLEISYLFVLNLIHEKIPPGVNFS